MIKFEKFKHLIEKIEKDLGQEFKATYRSSSKELAGLNRLPNSTIFSEFDKDESEWVYNHGGKKEIQYHIYLRDGQIGYGLGINSQRGSFNNDDPAKIANEIGQAFVAVEPSIKKNLPHYSYLIGNREQLGKMGEEEFILFGNTVTVNDNHEIDESEYQQMIEDLDSQLLSYIEIFKTVNKIQDAKRVFKIRLDMIERINELLEYKKQLILQGPPGTGKTRLAKEIAVKLVDQDFDIEYNDRGKLIKPDGFDEQVKIIQFHPSYTYEDFVRGISVSTENSESPVYKTENRHLGKLAKTALQSQKSGGTDDFERAWTALIEDITSGKVIKVGTSNVDVKINTQGSIKFGSPVATYETTYQLYKFGETDLKYETYQKITLKFLEKKYNLKKYVESTHVETDKVKNYVLIIDEINRANLSSVLGELIYALEYRGEPVESIYSTFDEKNKIIIPDNVFIIGTMNTADRSVGHIDYAIRRRFAFKSILPEDISDSLGDKFDFAREEFEEVKKLFAKEGTNWERSDYLSSDFDPKDVCIGHSYFIYKQGVEKEKEMRLKYEVKPILQEYARDGVFNERGIEAVNNLWPDA